MKDLLLGAREEGTVDTAHVALAREGGAKQVEVSGTRARHAQQVEVKVGEEVEMPGGGAGGDAACGRGGGDLNALSAERAARAGERRRRQVQHIRGGVRRVYEVPARRARRCR